MEYIPKRGHVINYPFPNDNPNAASSVTIRPCVILSITGEFLELICVTKTDRSNNNKGVLIVRNTKEHSAMKLNSEASFINLDDIKKLPTALLRSYKGYCPDFIMNQIDDLLRQ